MLHFIALVRRKFHEILQNNPSRIEYTLALFQQLNGIECLIKDNRFTGDAVVQLRHQEAKPVQQTLKTCMKQEYPAIVSKKSLIAQAIGKTLPYWGKLCTYTKDARLNIHNDMVENETRPVVVGRKKYLFDLSHEAEQRATIVYSLMATCKLHNINLYYWFWVVLENMNLFTTSNIEQLLPQNWKKLLEFQWVERQVTPSRYEPVFIELCELLITLYSTKMSATRLYSLRDKAIVEKSVKIGYNQFQGQLRNHFFTSLADLKKAISLQLQLFSDKPYNKTPYSRHYYFKTQNNTCSWSCLRLLYTPFYGAANRSAIRRTPLQQLVQQYTTKTGVFLTQ